jgi:TolB-like protein
MAVSLPFVAPNVAIFACAGKAGRRIRHFHRILRRLDVIMCGHQAGGTLAENFDRGTIVQATTPNGAHLGIPRTMDEATSPVPAPDEVRGQLERMAASDEFSRSPQLGAFLRFVVEAALDGKSDRIKAYTIGVDVLRRDTKFDPQLDPIVRVEATRLRRTIDRYYAGPGADDLIRIDLPRGSYIPTFTRRAGLPGVTARSSTLDRFWSIRLLLVAAVALLVLGVVFALWRRQASLPQIAAPPAAMQQRAATALPPGNGLPILLMSPFDVSGTPGPRSIAARSLQETLGNAFSHFDLVNVLQEPRDRQVERQVAAGTDTALMRDANADYRFSGAVEYADDGAARLLFKLTDVADGSIVWSRVFDRVLGGDDKAAAEEPIVRELAGILLQPFGVIYTRQRAKVLDGTLTDPRYRCLVEVIDSFRSFDPAQQLRGRDCLEELTTLDPNFALGFSYLAAVYLREYLYDVAGHPGAAPPLERGLIAARRGVELNPVSSRAYEMVFVTQFARRELVAAFDAANKALTLNRYDMRLLGSYGARLIASGDIDKGLAALRQAGSDGTVRPPFEEFFLFLGEYLRGDITSAIFHADQITNDSFQLGLIARALAAAAKGDGEAATRALARLAAFNPAWRDDTRGTLARFFVAPSIVDRLASDLAAAGLPVPGKIAVPP